MPNFWESLKGAVSPHTPPATPIPRGAQVEENGPLSSYLYAAVDVETTGLSPSHHDRIIELGIVLFSLKSGIQGEFETLVNPRRDVGAQHIHGLSMTDLIHAPAFNEICPSVINALKDRVVVAHNCEFDYRFLSAEFERASVTFPDIPRLCTMSLSADQGLGRRLPDVCAHLGVINTAPHTAIGDARAAAEVLVAWYRRHPSGDSLDLRSCGCVGGQLSQASWPGVTAGGTPIARDEASRMAANERGYLGRLIDSLPDEVEVDSPAEGAYLDVLERALEDRHLSRDEAQELESIAVAGGISKSAVQRLHDAFFMSLTREAWEDGVVSEMEANDLRLVGEFLGMDRPQVERAIQDERARDTQPNMPSAESVLVPGTTICFTGALRATSAGQPVTREQAEALARAAGLVVRGSVTKKLDILVMADPQSLSGKAQKARKYGTRILAESVFWRLMGVETD